MSEKAIIGKSLTEGREINRKIRIRNFRSLVMEDYIDIRKITLLFGKNGAGKSSFIKAIKFLGQNLYPIPKDQTVYNLEENIDLEDFKQIVFKHDIKKSIKIDFEEYWKKFIDSNGKRESTIINYSLNSVFRNNKEGKDFRYIGITDLINDMTIKIFPYQRNSYEGKFFHDLLDHKIWHRNISAEWLNEQNSTIGNSGYPNNSINIKREFFPNYPKLNVFVKYLDVLPFFDSKRDLESSYFKQLGTFLNFTYEQKEIVNYLISRFVLQIPQLSKKFFNHWYVTPVRKRPKSKYKLIGNKFDKTDYYGILYQVDNWISNYNMYYPGNELPNIIDFINSSLFELGIGKEFILRKGNGFGSVFVKDLNGVEHNLAESSSGLIQIIPIIVASYNALSTYEDFIIFQDSEESTDVIIIEQPELHLHPSLQTKLVDFIKKSMSTFIIETHSEHIIRKIQVLIARGELSKDKVAVYYFDKDEKTGATSIHEMKLKNNGLFETDWPNGFFDDSTDLTLELFDALRKN